MTINRLLTSLLFLLFIGNSISAQVLNPVKWKFKANHISGDKYELVFTAKMEKNWTVYSQFTSDDGPVPTYIEYEQLNGASIEGKAKEEGSRKEGFDKLFDTNVIKFTDSKPFIIRQEVKVADASKPISGYLTFMTCDKTKCLPPKDVDFSFSLPVAAADKGTFDGSNKHSNSTHAGANASVDQKPILSKEKIKSKKAPVFKSVELPIETKNAPVAKVIKVDNISNNNITVDIAGGEDLLTEEMDELEEMESPVIWEFGYEDHGNKEYTLIYRAVIDDAWNVYSQHTSDDGPVPTYIEYEKLNGASLLGVSTEEGHKKEGPDPLFDDVNVIKFLGDEDFLIKQRVKIGSGPIKGYLTYMTCDDSHCKPPTDVEFEFDPISGYAGLKRAVNNTAMKLSGNILDQKRESLITSYKEPLGDCGTETASADESYWKIFLGGFAGGLFAILLPCIFPMIPITVSFFTKDTKSKGWVNGMVYGLSIIAIFVGLGLAVTAILGPTALNELSTNWIANVLFFLIFIAFAISFFGYFEIALPSAWSTKTDQMADKGGLVGTFFMAATLAIVSFSCTGPIIGTALVQVANDKFGPAVIMFGFSLALAIPFGLFAAFPAWLNSLPKSGSWMTSVKVVLGFLELALALKFLSVADMTMGWGFLKYELFMGLWVIIFAAMTVYLLGWIRFPHDSPITKLGTGRKIFAGLSLLFTLYIASGFIIDKEINSYSIPTLVSGITPPASYNFFLTQNELDPVIKEKYPSYTKCANDINCFKDYYDGIAYANEVNKPVLLDFTGYGCVNCRKTEDKIWKDHDIKTSLNDDFVLISLYVDDRKKLKEMLLSASREVKLRNIGNKWADFQIVNFQQNSQPLYVPITTDEKVITPPRGYEEGIDNYREFLECSKAIFEGEEE